MKVGLLGVTGRAGRGALAVLKHYGCDVLAGCRHPENNLDVETMTVDLFNKDSLDRFVGRCDLVINCAGPAGLIGDTVAAACTYRGVPLIDPAGNDTMLTKVKKSCGNNGRIILSAGVYPGLCEWLMTFVCESCSGKIRRIDEVFHDSSALSDNALSDIIESLDSGEGDAFVLWNHSGKQRIDEVTRQSIRTKDGTSIYLLPYFYNEFESACRKSEPDCAVFYQGFSSPDDIEHLIQMKDKSRADNNATDLFGRVSGNGSFMIILDLITYDDEYEFRYTLSSDLDSGYVSGAVAAAIAVTYGSEIEDGVHFSAELGRTSEMIKLLKECGLIRLSRSKRKG